jgi:hypothetical protein
MTDPLDAAAALAQAKALRPAFAEAARSITEEHLKRAEEAGLLDLDDVDAAERHRRRALRQRLHQDLQIIDLAQREATAEANTYPDLQRRLAVLHRIDRLAQEERDAARAKYATDLRSAVAKHRFADPHQRASMSEAMAHTARLVVVEGQQYASVKAAARATGIAKTTIMRRIAAGAPGYSD